MKDMFLSRQPGQRLNKQVVGFSIAGIGALLIDLSVFNFMLFAGFTPSVGNVVAGAVALGTNFIINYFTFRSETSSLKSSQSFVRFSLVAVTSTVYIYGLFELFLIIAPESNELVLTLARILIIGSSSIARFFLYRRWVF